ncbi:sulfur carrier protein [Rhodoligotrophos appendicifer]|uniref:sulfur carrier protein ThiS n=1 Tax=Rhodoligotrophos appendicifer TaxID=987056 RepID=UPI001186231C|nr:sulfur carrier protein ThiS [Rhodoligotrophos appendicifer]
MKITINGDAREVTSTDLAGLLLELGYGEVVVATAVNEAFVPMGQRADLELAAGDRVEVLTPMQGG